MFYEAYPKYETVFTLFLVYKLIFKSPHINVGEVGCHSGRHSCSLDLDVMFTIESKIIEFKHDRVLGVDLLWFVFSSSSSTILSPSSMSILVYGLDTSSVDK